MQLGKHSRELQKAKVTSERTWSTFASNDLLWAGSDSINERKMYESLYSPSRILEHIH